VVTASRAAGTVIDFGDELLRIDDRPVVLAGGVLPMYRELLLASDHLEGDDVRQLQQLLLDLGFDDDGRLEADGDFGAATGRAVEDWQESLGLPETGRVDGSVLVFSPTPLRIASELRVGTAFERLDVTEPGAAVTVETSNRDRAGLPVGNPVSVELADGTVLDGTVADQERVVRDDGSTIWRSTIGVSGDLAGESSVLVTSVVNAASDVLIVPVPALLALAEGGFAVELAEPGTGPGLVAVDVGQVVAGRAEISGGVVAGDEVVVPA
jgi:peptidoglycan hydrolase-like protein with peptidoglycan-binding domain